MTTIAATGWLRSQRYDLVLIFGVMLLALSVGALSLRVPGLFILLLYADLWLLGYHHVISTFTRLTFDSESFQEHRFLVIGLPWIILAGVLAGVSAFGAWILPTTYLYWQFFHYTRQSYGIARVYSLKGTVGEEFNGWPTQGVLYLLPLTGILYRSYQAPSEFLFMPLKVIPVPFWLVAGAGILSLVAVLAWAWTRFQAYRSGKTALPYLFYMFSHLVIFIAGYLLIEDITQGWLVVNVWHNAQYILFVWLYNTNRFGTGEHPRHKFLAFISQPSRVWLYLLVCMTLTAVVYILMDGFSGWLALYTTLPVTLMAYQVVNFHHYVVDSLIWKVRKKSVSAKLGLSGG